MDLAAHGWRPVPLTWAFDLDHGGRWISLCSDGPAGRDGSEGRGSREWLWTHPDPVISEDRRHADGSTFVDAGGGEECWPTVRGTPDHGAAWSRPWVGLPDDATVEVPELGSLRRRVQGNAPVEVAYEIAGEPGTRFLHAVHLLLALSETAYLVVPGAEQMRVLDRDDPDRTWPGGLDRLGPDDGSATCAVVPLPGGAEVVVVDGPDALRLSWTAADQGRLCSLLLWRNLRGWPTDRPYRSIGIEPLLGRSADWRSGEPGDLPRVDSTGRCSWTLRLEGYRSTLGTP